MNNGFLIERNLDHSGKMSLEYEGKIIQTVNYETQKHRAEIVKAWQATFPEFTVIISPNVNK